jgi:phosphatidylglycerol lysyltransferase
MDKIGMIGGAVIADRPVKRFPLRRLAPLAGAVIFLLATRVIVRDLRSFHYHEVAGYLDLLPFRQVVLAIAGAACSYLALALIDLLGTRAAGLSLPLSRVTFASFVSAAVSNNAGLSGLAGGSLRYKLYTSWGVDAADTARIIAFAGTSFWLGFLTLSGVVLTLDPLTLPHFVGPALLVLPLGYFGFALARGERWLGAGRWQFALPGRRVALLQLTASCADWLFAALVFAAVLPAGRVNAVTALAVFLGAQVAGVASNLPGGVGVFEAAVIALLGSAVPAAQLAGALIAFRAIYYLLPLALAAVLLAAGSISRRRVGLVRFGRGVQQTVSLFAPAVFSIGVFVCGVVLLTSGATPAERLRVSLLSQTIPLPFVELAHLAGSAAGVGLLLLARGVQRRLNGAYVLACGLLAAGIAASLLKGLDYEEATILALTLGGLVACRREFYRRTALLDEPFTGAWIAAIALTVTSTFWIGFFAYRHIEYAPELWWRFSFGGDAPRFLRATLGIAAVVLVFSARKLMRASPAAVSAPNNEDLLAAADVARAKGSPNGFLVLLGDKQLLWNERRSAFLMYAMHGRSWVAMGDPIGSRDEARELAWQFFENADRHEGWPVFYQVRSAYLPLYVELGLRLMKLGEEARVLTATFTLEGGARKSLRHTVRRVEAAGVTLEVVEPHSVAALLPALHRVSRDWLALKNTREKRFSVGAFDESYLSRGPIVVVRQAGEIVAFANLWGDHLGGELTVDLMRHSSDAPPGTMDYLFARLIELARDRGYAWFNLGIAPLAGLEARAQGPLWGRAAALGVEHGAHFYNFQGLRQYKDKFGPEWSPVFLASPGGMRLPRILADVAALTSGGMRGILMK